MLYHNVLRGAAITCSVAAMLLATPAQGLDCLSWLFGGCGARTTYRAPYVSQTYAPAYSPPACTPCVPQTVRYVPQTCYRTVYRRVPVATCGAFTCSDPCTGCPVTYYRPVTSWTYQAAYVPYTTYRLVYSNPCNPCVTTSSYSPGVPSVGTTFGASGACCPPSTSGAPPYSGPSGATNGQAPGDEPPPGTFKEEESGGTHEALKAKADPEASSDTGPKLPDPGSRTTFRPGRQATRYHLITSPPKPVTVQRPKIDDGGWRAAKD